MSKSDFSTGDVLALYLEGQRKVLAKVLFSSNYFRNVILLGVHGKAFEADERPRMVDLSFGEHLLYTSSRGLGRRGWELYARDSVTEREHELSVRVVGGEVWSGDEVLRTASDDDLQSLPKMSVLGHKLLEKKITRLVGHAQSSA